MPTETPAKNIFPSPESDIIDAFESSIMQHIGAKWMEPFTGNMVHVIEALSATGGEDRKFIIDPDAYLTIAMDAIVESTHIRDNRLIFETFLKSLVTLHAKVSEWRGHALIADAQRIVIEAALQLHRSRAPKPVRNITVWWQNNIAFPMLSIGMPLELAVPLLDITMEKLAAMAALDGAIRNELPFFISALAMNTFASDTTRKDLLEHVVQSKAPHVLEALLAGEAPADKPPHLSKFEMLPLAALAGRRLLVHSRTVVSDATMWKETVDAIPRLDPLLRLWLPDALDKTFGVIRHTLVPVDKQRAMRWLSTACTTLGAWTKERPSMTPENDPTIAVTLAAVSFRFVEPMQADDARHLPRVPIAALYHPECLALNPLAEAAADSAGPAPPADIHFTANFFFIGLNYLHLIAGLIAMAAKRMQSLEMQRESLDSVRQPQLSKILDGLYRQQLVALAAMRCPHFIRMLKAFCDFIARWLVFTATGQADVSRVRGDSLPEIWRWVPQDTFWDIAQAIDLIIRSDPGSFSAADIQYWIHFATAFVADTAIITNKHHRASYATVLSLLCSFPGFRLDDRSCERVVHAVLRVYVDTEGLGQDKHTPRHALNVLLNGLCQRYPMALAYLSDRASDRNEDFTKFISYSIADANYMLDDSIMTLKAMSASFERGGDGGEPQEAGEEEDDESAGAAERRSTTREARMASLEMHMQFANQILALVETLCARIPAALLQGLVTKQVAYMLDYFLTQLAGPRMLEISGVPEDLRDACGFDHRRIVERLVQCYVGIAQSPQMAALRNAVASDGHYYSPAGFREIVRFLEAKRVRADILPHLKGFFAQVEKVYAHRQAQDALFADAPNEFLCQITYELLKAPALLPGMDGVWVEEEAIRHHLLFDDTNPFNRQTLTSSEFLDFNAQAANAAKIASLKAEIEAWKATKREASKRESENEQ